MKEVRETYLCAQMEVAKEHSRFWARDHEDDEHQKQEAEHVIRLVRPQRVQDKEKLDEDAAKG